MVDRRLILIFLALFVFSILSFSASAVCTFEKSEGMDSGFLSPNLFICPYDPISTTDKPPCPSEIFAAAWYNQFEPTKSYVSNIEYLEMQNEGAEHKQDMTKGESWDSEGFSNFKINWEGYENACYPGIEGRYYGWFQVHASTGPVVTESTDGYCTIALHEVDWDEEPEMYCKEGCVGHQVGTKPGLSCCGDDNNLSSEDVDCLNGESGDSQLCIDYQNEWQWLDIAESKGNIMKVDCEAESVAIASDGNDFWRCADFEVANTGATRAMRGDNFVVYIEREGTPHAYICFNDAGENKIAECAGGAHWSNTGGILKNSGGSVLVENDTYFCVMHREREDEATEWRTDLDGIGAENSADCELALLPDGNSAGLKWTGTKCCAEPEDEDESYNDIEGYDPKKPSSGGCWEGRHIASGMPVAGRDRVDIVNYRGGFEGCNVTDDETLNIKDLHTGEDLVNNNEICTVLDEGLGPNRHLFCSFSGNWVEADWDPEAGEFQLEMKRTAWDDDSFGCCAPDQCWDGEECIANMINLSEATTYHGNRCINGEWEDAGPAKYTWNKAEAGYCPEEGQCLVNPSRFADINCIESENYYQKFYCENGEWTSRTKLLALALMKYANLKSPNDYTVFCDSYDDILNYYDFQVGGEPVLNYMGEVQCQGRPCVNEFCVLKYSQGVAFGASLNEQISSPRSLLVALNQSADFCDGAKINDNRYHKCGANIWYNHRQGTLVVIPPGETFVEVDWAKDLTTFIRNPFEAIKDWIVPRTAGLEFLNETRIFTKIYVDVHGDKGVFAFLEEDQTVYFDDFAIDNVDYLGLEYRGLGVNACDLIRHYDPTISCSADQTIFAQSRVGAQKNLVDAWPDLTAKLRIG